VPPEEHERQGLLRHLRSGIGRLGRFVLASAGPRTFAIKIGSAVVGMLLSIATTVAGGFDFTHWRFSHPVLAASSLAAVLTAWWLFPRFGAGVVRTELGYMAATRILAWWCAFQAFWLIAGLLA
jgi:hypothetical protein